jgi:hypothetical protein
MTHEPMTPDRSLGDALRDVSDERAADVGWEGLRRAINERAAPVLTGRRRRRRRVAVVLPSALAASLALLLLLPRVLDQSGASGVPALPPGSIVPSAALDHLFDTDVSDRQFRALLLGAPDTDDLLLIAAAEDRP